MDVPAHGRNFRAATSADDGDRMPVVREGVVPEAIRALYRNATLRAADDFDSSADDPLLPASPPSCEVPVDRYYFVRNVFLLLGVVLMLPWNFTTNASDFWMYKFRNVSLPYDYTFTNKTELQAHIFGAFSVASSFPSLIAVYLGTLFNHRIGQDTRNILGFSLCIAFFSIVTAFVKINTDNWQVGFFILTVILISLLNVFVSWLQGGITGLAALLPSDYMHSLVIGMAVGGLFASVLQIICLLGHTEPTTAALAYFLCAIFVFVVALVCFLVMLSTDFFVHCVKSPEVNIQDLITNSDLEIKASTTLILRKVWPQAASAMYVMAVSLAVFPAVAVLVVSSNVESGSAWTGRFFMPVCGYLLFNAGDLTGRIVCSFVPLRRRRRWTAAFERKLVVNIKRSGQGGHIKAEI
ncbi:equilibrative nucleoside transporter 3-like isoform X2 [Dermacentor andersoni]|uniref:equilibrative nucleoside transporter 3-like isoform X2 n=1 Tax=Dermacentor andersoni TaxID=34620 RepID=UPI0024163B3E|nr:equilibrative nucleoside transporter 3-like isoform X2 [Dermacentor andersoni]